MPAPDGPNVSTRYVLVVDDSPVARLAIARRLRAKGLRVEARASAAEARSLGASPGAGELAGALLDLDLDDASDGATLAGELRAAHPGLPIAFFSATLGADLAARAALFGPLFHKPDQLDAAAAWMAASAREP